MKRLQQLDLSENLIDVLPEEVSGLVSLADLNLSQNSLNSLPAGIGRHLPCDVVPYSHLLLSFYS